METKESLVFNRYELEERIMPLELFQDLKKHVYTDENGLGFSSLRMEDSVIEANLIIRTPTTIQAYNPEDGTFSSNIVYLFDEIEIFIDTQFHLIYSTASMSKLNKLKTLFRNSINTKVTYMNLDFSAVNIIRIIDLLDLKAYISDLTIKNFRYKEGAYGRYIVHVDDAEIGKELLNIYEASVSKVTMKIESSIFSEFILSTGAQNTFTLKCKERDFWSIINLLKEHF